MAINEVLGLTVDVSATTDNFVKALEKAAASADLNVDVSTKRLIKSFKAAQADITGIFAKTVAEGASVGLGKTNLDKFIGKLQPLTDNIESSMKRIFKQEMLLRKQGTSEAVKGQLRTVIAEEKRKLGGLQARFKIEHIQADKIIKRRKDAVQEAERLGARSMSEAAEDMGESLGKVFADLKSGNVGGIFKGAGKRAGALGEGLKEKGAAAGGVKGGIMGALGGMLSKIGPALAAIGAIVAGFAAVVAMVIQADAGVKNLNRTLLTAGAAGVDLALEYGRIGSTMTNISKGFMDAFAFNQVWGTTAKDHLEILGSYAEAGITIRKMAEGIKDAGERQKELQKYTEATLTYSKLLGLSTKEVSEAMANYMLDLGFTLDGIQGKWANLTRAAVESGFATKRFFNMILQATSGMSMYNIRLEEAASLLISLGKILGQKMGGDMLQALTKGFKDEGTLDRVKKTMTTGIGFSLKVLREDAINSAEEFRRKLDDLGKSNIRAKEALNAALDEFGGKGTSTLNPAQLAEQLSKLTVKQQGMLLTRAEASRNDAMVRMLEHLIGKSQAFRGGLGGAQAARGLAGLGATALLQLNEAAKILGTSVDKIDPANIERMTYYENVSGRSGEELRKLIAVGKRFTGHHNVLLEEQTKIRKKVQRGEAVGPDVEKFNQTLGKQIGVVLDEFGNRWRAQLSETGEVDIGKSTEGDERQAMADTEADMFLKLGDERLGKEAEKVDEDTLLAQEIASNTTDIATILERGVEWLLSKIFGAVQWIASFFSDDITDKAQLAAKGRAITSLGEQSIKNRREMSRQQSDLQRLRRDVRQQEGPEKAQTLIDITKREQSIKNLTAAIDMQEEQLRGATDITKTSQLAELPADVPTSYIAAASMTPQFRAAANKVITTATGVSPKAEAEAGYARVLTQKTEEFRKNFQGMFNILKLEEDETAGVFENLAETFLNVERSTSAATIAMEAARESEIIWLKRLQEFGVGAGLSGHTTLAYAAEAASVGPRDPEDWLEGWIGETAADAQSLSDREMTKEEKQKAHLAKLIIDGIREDAEDAEDRRLAAEMISLGITASTPNQLVSMAKALRQTGTLPEGVNFSKRMINPTTKLEERLGDILLESTHLGGTGAQAIWGTLHSPQPVAPATKDFLMHIGNDGQVKFAQRIDGADGVTAVATKPGGGIGAAMQGAGRGGGTTIIQHNYSGMEAVQKGYRSLMAAKAL